MISTRKRHDVVAKFNRLLPTQRQADVLDSVIRLNRELGRTPSVREIAQDCKIQVNAVNGHLMALKRKRCVNWSPRSGRSLVVLRGIPLLGDVG